MKRSLLSIALLTNLVFPQDVLSDVARFSDVDDHHVYRDAIYALRDQNVLQGYADGSFGPEKPVSRAEALKMILAANEMELLTQESDWASLDFTDLEANAWYLPYLATGLKNGLIQGKPDGTFAPSLQVNKVEALKMLALARHVTLPEIEAHWYSPYLQWAQDEALILPNESGDWEIDKALTRGELAELIYRSENDLFTGEFEFGVATYYGYSIHGAGTASGRKLDVYAPMAAHKTLPFGTWVRVTNLSNNSSVDVEIVDRGPYGAGRIIDLTPSAFDAIGSLSSGVLKVRMEVLN
jgi:hypothetical protein